MEGILSSKKIFVVLLFSCIFSFVLKAQTKEQDLTIDLIDKSLDRAIVHAKNMSRLIENNKEALPRSIDQNGKLVTSDPAWWTSGFYPGELWYLYDYSRDKELLKLADKYSLRLKDQQFNTDNHDIGFMLNCSFGNGFRLTGNEKYKEILENGAKSLLTRFSPKVGLIRSWDFNKEEWQYPVIIDNLMNLELLFWVSKNTQNREMFTGAVSHASKTMKYHFRPDYSCWHVVSYDTISGLPQIRQTHQGLNDSSSWARGQSWALYGFTMAYRETKQNQFLKQAINVAKFIINHPSIPADKIPLWDFDAPKDSFRDASAAAIIASALIELSDYSPEYKSQFLNFAKQELISLSSDQYFAKEKSNGNYVLKHSVGNYPQNYEMDTPLSYADYYYVEALIRYRNLILKKRI